MVVQYPITSQNPGSRNMLFVRGHEHIDSLNTFMVDYGMLHWCSKLGLEDIEVAVLYFKR